MQCNSVFTCSGLCLVALPSPSSCSPRSLHVLIVVLWCSKLPPYYPTTQYRNDILQQLDSYVTVKCRSFIKLMFSSAIASPHQILNSIICRLCNFSNVGDTTTLNPQVKTPAAQWMQNFNYTDESGTSLGRVEFFLELLLCVTQSMSSSNNSASPTTYKISVIQTLIKACWWLMEALQVTLFSPLFSLFSISPSLPLNSPLSLSLF